MYASSQIKLFYKVWTLCLIKRITSGNLAMGGFFLAASVSNDAKVPRVFAAEILEHLSQRATAGLMDDHKCYDAC